MKSGFQTNTSQHPQHPGGKYCCRKDLNSPKTLALAGGRTFLCCSFAATTLSSWLFLQNDILKKFIALVSIMIYICNFRKKYELDDFNTT